MSACAKIVNFAFLIFGIACIAYYLALGFAVRSGQSMMFLWLLVGVLCIARFGFWTVCDHIGKYPPKALCWVVRVPVALMVAFFLAVEGIILASGMQAPADDLDCIIVLGARVNGRVPSGALRNRIQVAGEYLQAHPDAVAILSGGKGMDEDISEADCMLENLTAMGIDPARLMLEDRSTDTHENMLFSKELIPSGAKVGLVTNNFHIFRSLALARGVGLEVEAVPVATSWISFPHYMMREFIGLAHDYLRGNLKF